MIKPKGYVKIFSLFSAFKKKLKMGFFLIELFKSFNFYDRFTAFEFQFKT